MEDFSISGSDILRYIDEYTLYCHYLSFQPDIGLKYRSPIREGDQHASFGIFVTKKRSDVEYMWKDQGVGISGDIFDLIQYKLGLPSRQAATLRVKADFQLIDSDDPSRIPVPILPKPPVPIVIDVKSRDWEQRDLDFWKQFGITVPTLTRYQVKPIKFYWLTLDQECPRFAKLGYSYRIRDKYKLYFPYEKPDFKFRNNFDDNYLEGFEQLRFKKDLLVITKSLKDVMLLEELGYEAISPRSENTPIDREKFLSGLEKLYSKIVVLFDNDGKHRADFYPYPLVQIPKASGEKDVTDFYRRYGRNATEEVLRNILPV